MYLTVASAFSTWLVPHATADKRLEVGTPVKPTPAQLYMRDVALVKPDLRHAKQLRRLIPTQQSLFGHWNLLIRLPPIAWWCDERRSDMMEYHQTLQNHTTNLFSGQGSMKKTRVGRPRAKSTATTNLLTRRVRRLVDVAHDGNVHEASKVSGLAYATLRDLYTGRSTNPSLRTIGKLSDTYGVFPGWFTDERQQEEVPTGGWATFVSSMEGETSPAKLREVVIPFSSWPLPIVYERLCTMLEEMPIRADRPIIGAVTDEKEISRLVTEHLLSPFLDAEKISGRELIFQGAFSDRTLTKAREIWIMRLRRVGLLWQDILEEALPKAPK
jgi:hypothetical protein